MCSVSFALKPAGSDISVRGCDPPRALRLLLQARFADLCGYLSRWLPHPQERFWDYVTGSAGTKYLAFQPIPLSRRKRCLLFSLILDQHDLPQKSLYMPLLKYTNAVHFSYISSITFFFFFARKVGLYYSKRGRI